MALGAPKEMFEHARTHGYALGAFNVFSLESLLAVLDAAERAASPVIVQVSMGARGYVEHLQAFVDTIKRFAREYAVPAFIQHDHCATAQACEEAMDAGVQALMVDGSHLDFSENIRLVKQAADLAHARGVWVEAELGSLPGFEDLVFSKSAAFTDPALVEEFTRRSGCDCLAISVGTSHGGVRADGDLPLDVRRVEEIAQRIPHIPLALHGGASLPPELVAACNSQGAAVEPLRNCSEKSVAGAVKAGIRKVNMDVDNFLAFTAAARKHLNERPDLYDPRKYLGPAKDAFALETEHKMRHVLLSAGKAFL